MFANKVRLSTFSKRTYNDRQPFSSIDGKIEQLFLFLREEESADPQKL